jgi:uncharacterized membrane protein
MKVQSSQERRKQIDQFREKIYSMAMRGVVYSGNDKHAPSEQERNEVLTAFILGGLSIVTGFFPICGFPVAIAGLFMGLVGRRIPALHTMATWAVVLSLVGLTVTLLNLVVSISIYFSKYLWL